MLQKQSLKAIEDYLESEITDILPQHGGCINDTYVINSFRGKHFIKVNSNDLYPDMFQLEFKGLELLRKKSSFIAPKPLIVITTENQSILVLEFIEEGHQQEDSNLKLAANLASMHRQTNAHFGLDHDNFIGSLKQSNNKHDAWTDFFICERLENQCRLARNNSKIDQNTLNKFEVLYQKLSSIFSHEPPSLLHGDLWGGNYMFNANGDPCIYDPAIYYGHREMDIAMTTLFGGFDPEFYEIYNQQFPLAEGWEKRMEVCNLYPLMVHVNLFGGGYLNQVNHILNKWV